MEAEATRKKVLVLGAGFGGLTFCQSFDDPQADVILLDRQNHHLFQPLLYQVATAGLSAPEIAQPIRSILRDRPRVTTKFAEVRGVRLADRAVDTSLGELRYDYLVVALGGVTSYFGHPEWEPFAPGLKSLDDALRIRREVLLAFERAETEPDPARQAELMTIVVVGGGPTGVELAGAFAELARTVLARDFRRVDPRRAHVILVENSPGILNAFPAHLGQSAREQLEALGVEVRTGVRVADIGPGRVTFGDGTVLAAANIIWAAGVGASPVTRSLGVELDRAGRVKVAPDLSLPGHPEAFAIGDLAAVVDADGRPVPGVSPAAMQMARHVAKIIATELSASPGRVPARPAFRYWDKGSMATIGRSAAVAKVGQLEFTGLLAWIAWLLVHLLFLVGFRNKLAVLLQWAYSYFAYKRGARIIFGAGDAATGGRAGAPKPAEPGVAAAAAIR
ncbi:MAG TPA: NAD(P)/FAD-dependent oxidoreductase [Verrucomicrobiota bacterium]|nr:NAD(P)/FAD-dependent oxidoreductase [Verrucomicrobiota bacterium]